jgi:metal-responsive CopG/Arc/MetJ family transcriptional regulator
MEARAMVRVNITFDDETLRLADREARRRKTSRSDFIRSAVRFTAEQKQREVEAVALRARRQKAIEGIRHIAQEFGDWPAEQILHDMRHSFEGDRD